jgi:hypothetical protein
MFLRSGETDRLAAPAVRVTALYRRLNGSSGEGD